MLLTCIRYRIESSLKLQILLPGGYFFTNLLFSLGFLGVVLSFLLVVIHIRKVDIGLTFCFH